MNKVRKNYLNSRVSNVILIHDIFKAKLNVGGIIHATFIVLKKKKKKRFIVIRLALD